MNKFEALNQFQSWPPEWQRLCAEYWIETAEVEPKFVLAFPKQAAGEPLQPAAPVPDEAFPYGQPVSRQAIPCNVEARFRNGDPVSIPFDRPKAAKVAAAKPRARIEYTLQELDFLDNLIYSELGPTLAVKKFCKRFPNSGHPKDLKTKFYKRRQELKERGDL
jgi:hypothetical protein